jgi:hypothetical protein
MCAAILLDPLVNADLASRNGALDTFASLVSKALGYQKPQGSFIAEWSNCGAD